MLSAETPSTEEVTPILYRDANLEFLAVSSLNTIGYFAHRPRGRHSLLASTSINSQAYGLDGSALTRRSRLTKEELMNPLDSIPGTITAGFVLTVVLYVFVKMLV